MVGRDVWEVNVTMRLSVHSTYMRRCRRVNIKQVIDSLYEQYELRSGRIQFKAAMELQEQVRHAKGRVSMVSNYNSEEY